jgi:hypothetical protein
LTTYKTLAFSIDEKVFGFVRQIQDIIDNDEADSRKLALLKCLLETHQTYFPDIEQQWQDFRSGFDADDPSYYDILEERSLRLQNRVSPILKALEFHGEIGPKDIVDAIDHFKKTNGVIRHNAPTGFLESAQQQAVAGNGTFRPSLYKALLFMHVANAIKSGQLNLENSYKYRSLDEHLISKDRLAIAYNLKRLPKLYADRLFAQRLQEKCAF